MNLREKYATFSDKKLLDIWENRSKFGQEALDALEFQLKERGIDPEQLVIDSDNQEAISSPTPLTGLIHHINQIPKSLFSLLFPLRSIDGKLVSRGIGIVMMIIALFNLNLIRKDIIANFPFTGFLEISVPQYYLWILTVGIPLLGGLFLYFQKSNGWYLSVMYLEYQLLSQLPFHFLTFNSSMFFDTYILVIRILSICIFLILLYRLFSNVVRHEVQLDPKIALTIVVGVGLYCIIQIISVFRQYDFLMN